ncbi:hypothetical protein Tsubulata_012485 [Turnera subulata]|uniref:Uncharacterized protein n=1 Tax=Turnera subulata TaxID=218843 RepID=A0A9Q0GJJ3_9ROSI|nr:hypothetical protein Tsubulata_012485 [Turnera subulata]
MPPPPLPQPQGPPPPPPQNNVPSSSLGMGFFPRPPSAPLSPLPPFPAVHAAAESPVSAYMRPTPVFSSSASAAAAAGDDSAVTTAYAAAVSAADIAAGIRVLELATLTVRFAVSKSAAFAVFVPSLAYRAGAKPEMERPLTGSSVISVWRVPSVAETFLSD